MKKKLEIAIPLHTPNLKEKIFFLLSGAIIGIPVNVYLHNSTIDVIKGLSPFYLLLISEIILAPFIEEFSKLFAFLNRHGETQKSLVDLAFLGGLGFGIAEFVILTFDRGIFFVFNVPGIFFHPLAVVITVYGLAMNQTLKYYLVAVLLHFLHNLFLFFISPINLPITILTFIFSMLIVVLSYLISNNLKKNL